MGERTKALRVLNIKPSTFHSLHSAGKTKKLQKILEQSLLLRTKDAQERTQEEMKEDFNINFEANMFSSLSMLLLNHKKLGLDMWFIFGAVLLHFWPLVLSNDFIPNFL